LGELDPSTLCLIDVFEEIAGFQMELGAMAEREAQREADYSIGETAYKANISSLQHEIKTLISKLRAQDVEICNIFSTIHVCAYLLRPSGLIGTIT
jgi:hypothetical protein